MGTYQRNQSIAVTYNFYERNCADVYFSTVIDGVEFEFFVHWNKLAAYHLNIELLTTRIAL